MVYSGIKTLDTSNSNQLLNFHFKGMSPCCCVLKHKLLNFHFKENTLKLFPESYITIVMHKSTLLATQLCI